MPTVATITGGSGISSGIDPVTLVRNPGAPGYTDNTNSRRRPPRPPSGFVTLWNETQSLTAILKEEPDADMGAAVYEDLEREGDVPVGRFKGMTNDTMSLQLRLQLGLTTNDVEADIATLLSMGRREGDELRPGGVWIIGELPVKPTQLMRIDGPIKLPRRRYVAGSRLTLRWQELSLTLTALVTSSTVAHATPRATRAANGKRRVRTIKTVEGDSMRRIAVAQLGESTRWRDLRAWNPKLNTTDPDAKLRRGTSLVIR